MHQRATEGVGLLPDIGRKPLGQERGHLQARHQTLAFAGWRTEQWATKSRPPTNPPCWERAGRLEDTTGATSFAGRARGHRTPLSPVPVVKHDAGNLPRSVFSTPDATPCPWMVIGPGIDKAGRFPERDCSPGSTVPQRDRSHDLIPPGNHGRGGMIVWPLAAGALA